MGQNGAGGRMPSAVSAEALACLVWKDPQLQGPCGAGSPHALGLHPFQSQALGSQRTIPLYIPKLPVRVSHLNSHSTIICVRDKILS